MSKAKKKGSNESHVALCAYVASSSNSSSSVEWIMDFHASKNMTGNASLLHFMTIINTYLKKYL